MAELNFKVQRIHRLIGNDRIKAFVDLNIGDALIVKGLKILESKNGLFVSMPQEQGKDKKWYDSIRCLDPDVKFQINRIVIDAFHKEEQMN